MDFLPGLFPTLPQRGAVGVPFRIRRRGQVLEGMCTSPANSLVLEILENK
jgi:hypothetical protein